MNILITGSDGFIGKNLKWFLTEKDNINIYEFDINNSFKKIEDIINDIDVLFHFAGVNRPKNDDEFKKGNTDLTSEILNLLTNRKKQIKIVLSSSSQATKKNLYGKSKYDAENLLFEAASNNSNIKPFVYRFQNVFGKWCRPNYNSVVATFCHNIANDIEISISDKNFKIELLYIDTILDEMYNIISNNINSSSKPISITKTHKVTLGYLADTLYGFKGNMNSIYVPQTTQDEFHKFLFSTFISYYNLDNILFSPVTHKDNRGGYTELIRTIGSGQFSVSHSKPGIVRGRHYHHTKMERFIVIKGKARIGLRKLGEKEVRNFYMSDENIQIITIPVGYTHDIENIGDDEMILVMWSNELFNKDKPDTFFHEVNVNE